MPDNNRSGAGVLADISANLSGIFRHMLPGVLIVGTARIAHTEWFWWVRLESWPHLAVLAIIAIAIGNAWFGLNRYGPHQVVDYVLYMIKSKGPAREREGWNYLDDLGQHTYRSLHTPDTSSRARSHVAFRASTVLLILTFGEAATVFGLWHSSNSILAGYPKMFLIGGGCLALAIGVWQMVITRRIDYYVVNQPD
jgi:hypothetical protein